MENAASQGLISVIVVAADSGNGLLDCVVRALASSVPVEVIVSDNDSMDGSIETVARHCADDSRLRIARNGRNLGYGVACNRAAVLAHGDMLLFLNPDCFLAPDTIERLQAIVDVQVDLGLLGAKIVDENGTCEPASRRRDPLMRRAIMSASGLARWQYRWPALTGIDLPNSDAEVEEVDAVSGALMLMPRVAFVKVGGFDEGYFLHCEDLDLCRRVRDAGLRVVCANAVKIVHGKGGSSRHRPLFVAWHKHRGMWRWFCKFDPAARNPVLRAAVWSGLWLHFVLLSPRYAWVFMRHRRASNANG